MTPYVMPLNSLEGDKAGRLCRQQPKPDEPFMKYNRALIWLRETPTFISAAEMISRNTISKRCFAVPSCVILIFEESVV
jgi:hypothetical protein